MIEIGLFVNNYFSSFYLTICDSIKLSG